MQLTALTLLLMKFLDAFLKRSAQGALFTVL